MERCRKCFLLLFAATFSAGQQQDRQLQASRTLEVSVHVCNRDNAEGPGLTVSFPDNIGSAEHQFGYMARKTTYTATVMVTGSGPPPTINLRSTEDDGVCVNEVKVDDVQYKGAQDMWLKSASAVPIGVGDTPIVPDHSWLSSPGGSKNAQFKLTLCDHDNAKTDKKYVAYFPDHPGARYLKIPHNDAIVEKNLKYWGPLPSKVVIATESDNALCIASVSLDDIEFLGNLPAWLDLRCDGNLASNSACALKTLTLELPTTTTSTTTMSTTTSSISSTVTSKTVTGTDTTTTITVTSSTSTHTSTETSTDAETEATSASAGSLLETTPAVAGGGFSSNPPTSTLVGATTTTPSPAEVTSASAGSLLETTPAVAGGSFSSNPPTSAAVGITTTLSPAEVTSIVGDNGGTLSSSPATSFDAATSTVHAGWRTTTSPGEAAISSSSTASPTAIEDSAATEATTTANSNAAGTTQGAASGVQGTATSVVVNVEQATTPVDGSEATTTIAPAATSAVVAAGQVTTAATTEKARPSTTLLGQESTIPAAVSGTQGAATAFPRVRATTAAEVPAATTTVPRVPTTSMSPVMEQTSRIAEQLAGSTTANVAPTASTATSTAEATVTSSTASGDESSAADVARSRSRAVSRAVQAGIAQFLKNSNGSSATLDTALGTVTMFNLQKALSQTGSKPVSLPASGGGKLSIPSSMLGNFPAGSALGVLSGNSNSGSNQEDLFPGLENKPLTPVMDISIFDRDGNLIKAEFSEPLLFRLPGSGGGGICAYLETPDVGPPRWSRRGVWRATDDEIVSAGEVPGGVWCKTLHLSIFAAIADVLLGCTNLELISADAARSVLENETWYKSGAASIVFTVWAILVLAVITGVLRECYAMRLGRSHEAWKSVNICRNFLKLGPQLLKHRYVIFLVYARDVFHCMRSGRTKLKMSTLTSSVQRFLAVRTGISVQCVTQHCWNGGGWINSAASVPYTVFCHKLQFHAGAAESVIQNDVSAPGFLGALRRFGMTFLSMHPLIDAMRVGAGSMTVAKRTTLQVAGICGVIATNALIFNFSGDMRSWEADADCPINPKSQLFIVVASIVSVLVNAVPNAFLSDLGKQVHGRPLWNMTFWAWTSLYLAWAVYMIVVALANSNPKDQDKWYASLEWGMSFKLIGVPLAQSFRNWLLLELFLREDRQCKPTERFRAVLGLCHPNEKELSEQERQQARVTARQAISAEELITFTSLLGDAVMPEFQPETSTAEEVMLAAVPPLAVRPRPFNEFSIDVQVDAAKGLFKVKDPLICSVVHLGKLTGNIRFSLGEQGSHPVLAREDGTCSWGLKARITGFESEHALAFVVTSGGESLGVAILSYTEMLSDDVWSGNLALHNTAQENKSFQMPSEAALVPRRDVAGSQGLQSRTLPTVAVKVALPDGYREAAELHALQKVKSGQPQHDSEVVDENVIPAPSQLQVNSVGIHSFCEEKHGCHPADTMVVHSRDKVFIHLVATILADALGQPTAYKSIEAKLHSRDFHDIYDLLREAGCNEKRYWMEMFALPPSRENKWHESFMSECPTILREMRRASCQKMVSDIESGKIVKSPGPLTQLLIMDKGFHFMREESCLSELMLAKAMRVRQRLVLHPDHLEGGSLGEELSAVAKELGRAYNNNAVSYTVAYLEDKQAVYDTLKDLIVANVKEHKDDHASTWQELSLDNIAATIVAVEAGRAAGESARDDVGGDMGDLDFDA